MCGWTNFIGKPWAKFGMAKREGLAQCHIFLLRIWKYDRFYMILRISPFILG